jgi:hypothetical protein
MDPREITMNDPKQVWTINYEGDVVSGSEVYRTADGKQSCLLLSGALHVKQEPEVYRDYVTAMSTAAQRLMRDGGAKTTKASQIMTELMKAAKVSP